MWANGPGSPPLYSSPLAFLPRFGMRGASGLGALAGTQPGRTLYAHYRSGRMGTMK